MAGYGVQLEPSAEPPRDDVPTDAELLELVDTLATIAARLSRIADALETIAARMPAP